jgi:hypothetical protein
MALVVASLSWSGVESADETAVGPVVVGIGDDVPVKEEGKVSVPAISSQPHPWRVLVGRWWPLGETWN